MIAGRKIAVIGAGIGGMTAALACARQGAEVVIFEKSETLGEVGAGLQLAPNAIKVLKALGVGEAVLAAGNYPDSADLRHFRSGSLLARVPLGAAAVQRWGGEFLQIHRRDLLDCLINAASAAGVRIQTGSPVQNTDVSGEVICNGQAQRFDLVVAADGVRSRIRAQHISPRQARFNGQVAWRGIVPVERLAKPLPNAASVYLGPGRHFVTYPLRRGQVWNVVAVEERDQWAEEGWSTPGDVSNVRAAFCGWADEVQALLEGLESCFLWGLFSHPPLPSWRAGRIVLLGDAAHPMLPFMAQGAGMAIEDAFVLSESLAANTIEQAIEVYEARRKPRATRVQTASAGNARIYHARAPRAQILHLGMRLQGAFAPTRMQSRFDWLYGADVTRG